MNINEDFIIRFAGNPGAVSNGRSLAGKGKFQSLYKSADGTLLFGSCAGSGKSPYQCSVDFADESNPVARCSCPSRQIPCKHAVGLLFCHAQGKKFLTADIPDDVAAKRAKLTARAEKKTEAKAAEKDAPPKEMTKARAGTAAKKCRAQLEGIELAEKILHNIVLAGLHSIDRKNEKLYQDQVKELGNYYIGGIQTALTDLLLAAAQGQKEQQFTEAVAQVNYLYALLGKAKAHTHNKIVDCEHFPEMTSTAEEATLHSRIEEQMGYAWKLSELREKGLFRENEALLQLGFDCREDPARREFVDEGIWVALSDGRLFNTYNYRPFRAQKYVRAEDSFYPVLTVPELYIYPGEENPRVRWEGAGQREAAPADFAKAKSFAHADYAAVLKLVKNQIKSPLADKNPVFALKVAALERGDGGTYVIRDEAGTAIPLKLEQFGFLIGKLSREQVEHQVMVCRFAQDLQTDLLAGVPIAMITDDAVIRFRY